MREAQAAGNSFWVAYQAGWDEGDYWTLIHGSKGIFQKHGLEYLPEETRDFGMLRLEARYIASVAQNCRDLQIQADEWSSISCQ